MCARPVAVTVVTVTHDREELLLRKAQSLMGQTLPAERFEWRVLANADAAAAAALRRLPTPFDKVVLESDENLPIGAARNRAAEGGHGSILLMSDDDCLPSEGCLAAHVEAHRGSATTVVVGPLRLPEELRSGRQREPFERAFGLGRAALWIHATGANTSIPRRAFEAVGGYDESFVEYGGEDPDLALRLRESGARFRFARRAWAYHAGRTLGQDPKRAYLAGRAQYRVYRNNGGLDVGLLLGVHPILLTLKRWVLGSGLRRLLSPELAQYESAYLEGALAARAELELS